MPKKIIFIPGIFNPKWYQYFWRKEALKKGFEFIEFENPYYSYWSIKNMKRIIKEGVEIFEKYKDDEVYVVCHSFGGILINCILQNTQQSKILGTKGVKNYRIKKLFILASPLQIQKFGMKKRKKLLGYDENFNYDCKVLTYGAYFDPAVTFNNTKYGDEEHKNIFGEHMTFLFSKKLIRKILKNI